MTITEYFTTATALQRHEANCINAYRKHIAKVLRDEADAYDLRALEADPSEARELSWISYGLRIAATKVLS